MCHTSSKSLDHEIHADLYLFKVGHTVSLSVNMTLRHQIVGDIRHSHWAMKYRSHSPTFILR